MGSSVEQRAPFEISYSGDSGKPGQINLHAMGARKPARDKRQVLFPGPEVIKAIRMIHGI
jgi:hypothetical protein